MNGWVNNHEAGDLRRHCAHYDVTVMFCLGILVEQGSSSNQGKIIVAIVIGLLVLLVLVGNIVSFLTFCKMPKNATTFLLCSLAVIDSSFLLLTAIPLAMKLYAVQSVGCCDL